MAARFLTFSHLTRHSFMIVGESLTTTSMSVKAIFQQLAGHGIVKRSAPNSTQYELIRLFVLT